VDVGLTADRGLSDHLAPRQQRLKRRAAEPPPRPADFIRHAGDGERNEIPILLTQAFRYTAEIRKLGCPSTGYSFRIASTWPAAKDPTAEQTTLQMTLDAAGLREVASEIRAQR
jgi:hypothetical protein